MSLAFDPSSVFRQAIEDHLAVIDSLRDQQSLLQGIAEEMTRAILAGKKVLWCGNGGSAADSQHLAAELMGRFRRERYAFPSKLGCICILGRYRSNAPGRVTPFFHQTQHSRRKSRAGGVRGTWTPTRRYAK